ncbi:hypothetical protein IRZ71_21700 [Flavobacterium sp. ANB]|uniref:hypothetical protein n=1 Tax=Flavobacterium sp. ANB TaxID=2783790 RepID=UPI00188B6FEC|nr:hypothetical protein [Flavobacterium sp. ANB]MBF4518980.1 hypothetical protein [Flavobacterium sp. ANB]
MKRLILLAILASTIFGCSNEPLTVTPEASMPGSSAKPSSASTSQWSDYNISVSVSTDGTIWTYTITRLKANAKDLSHFIIDLNNCGAKSATFADIVWGTVNGYPANLVPTEGSGTTCNPQAITNNFVKFNDLPSATSWILVLKFDRGYDIATTAIGWIKAGTSCNQGTIPGPGCPVEVYCSYSQGFFFANGADNNGASQYWTNGLTIGGITYTQAQGNNAWSIDKGQGGDQTMNGFFQLGAVRLSGIESQVAADAAIIDTYFTGLNIFSTLVTNPYSYFNLPAVSNGITKNQVIAAGGRIGDFIDANHCP